MPQCKAFTFTCVDSLVAGQIPLVAEGRLTMVTLVRLVTVGLEHVVFQRIRLREFGVTLVAKVGTIL